MAEPPGTRQTIAGMVTRLLKLKGTLEPHRENSVVNDAELEMLLDHCKEIFECRWKIGAKVAKERAYLDADSSAEMP